MINSNKPKKDKYEILDDLTKIVKEKKTKKKTKKDKKSKDKNVTIANLNQKFNIDQQDPATIKQVILHTEKDNLIHNYFHYFDFYWDARDCLSSAIIKFPKTEQDNLKYWINYTGEISIYMGADVETENVQNKKNKKQDGTYWALRGMTPFFKGDVGQVTEKAKEFEVRIDSIGKRFKQKIPDEFRQQYINGQNVRDAFQAICEFLGVKYICPPPTTEQENPETDGTENDPNTQQSREQSARNQSGNSSSQSAEGALVDVLGKINQLANQAIKNATDLKNNQNNDAGQQNTAMTGQSTGGVDDSPQLNGYADISFDANGAITHASATVEESPDMVETLIEMEEHPLDKYLEDVTNVSKNVTALLKGHYFDTVHNNVMDYGAITIQPKNNATTTPMDMSQMDQQNTEGTEGTDGTGSTDGTTGNTGTGNTG